MLNRRRLALLAALCPSMLRAQPGVNQPQSPLPTEPLVIETGRGAAYRFTVEMALTPAQQMVGLMFRPEVAPDGGMLFDWGTPRESAMWMRNTITSLDMLFIRADGRIHRIVERTVPLSLNTIESRGAVRATLELAAGTAARLDIRPGDLVRQRIFGNPP